MPFERNDADGSEPSGARSPFAHDPIEDDPRHAAAFAAANEEATRDLDTLGLTGKMGSCHAYWSIKKRVIRERFAIAWRAPDDMNPGVLFD